MLYTIEQLRERHSVRSFTTEPIHEDHLKALNSEITMINTHEAGMHFRLVTEDSDPFSGFTSSYGFFKNARNYLACVVDTDFPDYMERAGYLAQQFVMKAQSLGLSTCYVGGTYNAGKVNVQMRAGWKLLFIVLTGYKSEAPASFVAKLASSIIHRKKRTIESFFEGDFQTAVGEIPYLRTMLEALACAPSSLNKQPVKVRLEERDGVKTVCAGVDASNPKNLIDLGIAKFNMAAVGDGVWDWGNYAPYLL